MFGYLPRVADGELSQRMSIIGAVLADGPKGGKIGTLRMRLMSLFTPGHSTGEISLAGLLRSEVQSAMPSALSVPELMERVVTGWPGLIGKEKAVRSLRWEDQPDNRPNHLGMIGTGRRPGTIQSRLHARQLNVAAVCLGDGDAEDFTDRDRRVEFFENLALERRRRGLTRLDLPTRELPPASNRLSCLSRVRTLLRAANEVPEAARAEPRPLRESLTIPPGITAYVRIRSFV